MVDGSKLFKKGRSQNTLEAEHAAQLLAWYQAYQDVAGSVRVVSLEEVANNDYNLNIPRFIEPLSQETKISVEDALRNLKTALSDAYQAEDNLIALLKNAGLMEDN